VEAGAGGGGRGEEGLRAFGGGVCVWVFYAAVSPDGKC